MWTPQYFVRLVDLPERVRGVTVPNDDGTFDVYISLRLSPERRRECLEHELRHICRDHFYSENAVDELERDADGLASPVPAEAIPYFPTLADMLRLFKSQGASGTLPPALETQRSPHV